MDDIDLTFIDEDFEFNKIDVKNPLLDLEEESVESNNIKTEEKNIKEEKKESKKNKKNKEKNQKAENDDDLLSGIYNTLEEHSKLVEKLNEKTKEFELLKLDFEKIKDEKEYLNRKYKSENEAKIKLDIELKRIKSNLIEKEKKILMLKTLLQLIIREYGIEKIATVTRLNMDQLKKFLN